MNEWLGFFFFWMSTRETTERHLETQKFKPLNFHSSSIFMCCFTVSCSYYILQFSFLKHFCVITIESSFSLHMNSKATIMILLVSPFHSQSFVYQTYVAVPVRTPTHFSCSRKAYLLYCSVSLYSCREAGSKGVPRGCWDPQSSLFLWSKLRTNTVHFGILT
jgi:hypothetical protein